MARMVVVDCNVDERDWMVAWRQRLGPELEVVRAQEGLPTTLTGWDAVFLSGSAASVIEPEPWQPPLESLLREVVAADVPVLGVCFGHQLLCRALFGPDAVSQRERAEVGWLPVALEPHPLLRGFEAPFTPFVSHRDEVRPMPGLHILGRTRTCPVHAVEVRGARAWGVQFHVEMTDEEEQHVVHKRVAMHPELDLSAEDLLAKRVDAWPLGTRLFDNFRSLVGL